MSQTPLVALVRHAEVHNPDHVVYADLPGFGLSDRGWSQADATAARLAGAGVGRIVTSPLQRAVETGNAIAARCGLAPVTDERLTEWALGTRWAGIVWEDLPERMPGELEAYLEHPAELPFAPESIEQVADRVTAVIKQHLDLDGLLVVVSHQDPVQAARLHLTGRPAADLHADKPMHGSVTMLGGEPGRLPWAEIEYWEPDQGPRFPPVSHAAPSAP